MESWKCQDKISPTNRPVFGSMINMRSKFSQWELSTMRRRWNTAGFGCDCERLLRYSHRDMFDHKCLQQLATACRAAPIICDHL
jgi:hypothetical protein